MRFTQNISVINSLIRITVGFTIIVWSIAKLVKQPWRESFLFMALIGGMKIGEGILRFCPFVALFERYDDWDEDYFDFCEEDLEEENIAFQE